jgi:hypothetical protein
LYLQVDGSLQQLICGVTVTLRNATLNDLPLLLQRDGQDHVKDPTVMGDEEYNDWNWAQELAQDQDIAWRLQLIATVDNNNTKPFGMIQIIDPLKDESKYWSNGTDPSLRALDIWIGEADYYLGKGYGTQMNQYLHFLLATAAPLATAGPTLSNATTTPAPTPAPNATTPLPTPLPTLTPTASTSINNVMAPPTTTPGNFFLCTDMGVTYFSGQPTDVDRALTPDEVVEMQSLLGEYYTSISYSSRSCLGSVL